ncbi:MAG: hypothetical protein IPK55_11315 [Streptococcus sp.]|nr:hypothetical protein [Streptococcus sp.]
MDDFDEIWNFYLDPKYLESEESSEESVSSDDSYIMVDVELKLGERA